VQIANYALPMVSLPIISRVIGPEKFGIVNYAAAFMTYFNILITYGFDLTATRSVAKDPYNSDLRNKVFSEVLQAQFFLLLISTGLFVLCLYVVPPFQREKEVAIFSFLFCIGTLFTQNWLFQAMQDLAKIALFDFVSKLLFTTSILFFIKGKSDYIWLPLTTSIIQITIAIASFIWAIRRYNLKFIKTSIIAIFFLLKNESVVFFSLILITLYTTTNIIILGLFQTSEKVGFYTGAQKLIIVAYSVVTIPISHTFFPVIGKAFAENHQKGLLIVQKIIPIIIIITGMMGITMLIFGPWALRIFYGREFEPSVIIFQILAFTPMFIALGNIFSIQVMLNLKMDKQFFKITATGAILSVATNFLLANKFGYIGTALNWLFTEIFITTTMYIFLLSKGTNPIDLKQFYPKALKIQFEPLLEKIFHFKSISEP
jgi:O-antigen/teichoic acid export membrane protein